MDVLPSKIVYLEVEYLLIMITIRYQKLGLLYPNPDQQIQRLTNRILEEAISGLYGCQEITGLYLSFIITKSASSSIYPHKVFRCSPELIPGRSGGRTWYFRFKALCRVTWSFPEDVADLDRYHEFWPSLMVYEINRNWWVIYPLRLIPFRLHDHTDKILSLLYNFKPSTP